MLHFFERLELNKGLGSDASHRSNTRSNRSNQKKRCKNNKVYSLKREEVLSFYRSVEATEVMKQKLPSSTIYLQKRLNTI